MRVCKIAPFLDFVGLAQRIDLVLLVLGVAFIVGIGVTGTWVDRGLRVLTLLSLAVFAMAALALGMASSSPNIVLLSVAIWVLTFGGAPTLLQKAIADTAGDGADVAQSILVTNFILAVAGGGTAAHGRYDSRSFSKNILLGSYSYPPNGPRR